MKRSIILIASLCLALGSQAQNDSTTAGDAIRRGPTIHPDATHDESPENKPFSIDFGISAGATLFSGNNNHSPYYSHHGFTVQLPLMAHWNLSPHWKFSTGLRYDFNWTPLYYAVEPRGNEDPYRYVDDQGLQFRQTPTTATQKAYAYHSHIGIPVEIKWYPWRDKKSLGIALDLFAAYAVTQYFTIDEVTPREDGFNWEGYQNSTFSAMNPWKLEVGLSLTTGLLGLTHGIRFFTNLLPTYQDPATGEKIYTSGMTFFL